MEAFLNDINFFTTSISIFLTRNGNIQFQWENDKDKLVELEFFLDKIEYYIESLEETDYKINPEFKFLINTLKKENYVR